VKTTIKDILVEASRDLALSEIYPLLKHVLNKPKEFLFTHPEYTLSPVKVIKWKEYKKRRLAGEPVSYITGEKEFYSLSFKVNGATLIPRPETELLVEEIIQRKPKSILDIGTGSGNIAITVKYHLKESIVVATDTSREALLTARENERRVLGRNCIRFVHSDFFQDLNMERYEIIVSNPPYIRSEGMEKLQPEIRFYEPGSALNGGADGLDAYRRILRAAWRYLLKNGVVILEIDPDIVAGLVLLIQEEQYKIIKIAKDLNNAERMIVLVSQRY
jgi:release factor glutamine methyltransferase